MMKFKNKYLLFINNRNGIFWKYGIIFVSLRICEVRGWFKVLYLIIKLLSKYIDW